MPSSNDILVTLDGVTQYPTDSSTVRSYSVIESTLTFVSAPDTGVAIQVRHIGFAGATTSAVTGFYGRQGNVALTGTDDVSVQNISGVGATFTSNVNIEGVLTYEDVTNVDSIGIITARAGVLVGSGITLSKDGDVFFTGIATGNGSGLTALNASNISSGTVPTARLGSGTASSSTFLAGDSTFKTVTGTTINNNADNRLITGSGTANTLEGEANITFDGTNLDLGDSKKIRLGASQDLELYHGGTDSQIVNNTGQLKIAGDAIRITDAAVSETQALFTANGAVELYYDNSKKLETTTIGVTLSGDLKLPDNEEVRLGDGNDLQLYHNGSQSYVTNNTGNLNLTSAGAVVTKVNTNEDAIVCNANGSVDLYYDNSKKLETTTHGIKLGGASTIADSSADDLQIGLGTGHHGMTIYSGTAHVGAIYFADGSSGTAQYRGYFQYEHNNDRFILGTAGSTRLIIDSSGHLTPHANDTYDLGTSSLRWRNLYTTDLQLSNEGKTNDVDGTWGDYTIQEGESDLFLINNRSGKKYKFNLTEVS